ncbi:hypothetical protein FF021_20385 [Leptospira noguchii]|nr:hypothetical protein [Leptospira noguchii]TQE63135.1 hypothetical protein FF021_20385 [Leptospira noguchii]
MKRFSGRLGSNPIIISSFVCEGSGLKHLGARSAALSDIISSFVCEGSGLKLNENGDFLDFAYFFLCLRRKWIETVTGPQFGD